MRISSEGDVPRVDLDTLRRLVPPLWDEWADLQFASDGRLRDPDTGQPLSILQLVHGRHRVPGATYNIVKDKSQLTFDLTFDRSNAVRGTLSSQFWSADLEIGDKLSAVGRADVRAILEVNDVPGFLTTLIGGREATGNIHLDASTLERGGDLAHGDAAAQRGAGDFVAHVKNGHDEWHGHLTVHVSGRGLIGRVAFLAFRSKFRSSIREGLEEFFSDTAKEAVKLKSDLAELDDQIHAAGGERAFVHKYLWEGVRELMSPVEAAASTGVIEASGVAEARGTAASTPTRPAAAGVGTTGTTTRLRRGPLGVRRLQRPAELRFPLQSERYLINQGRMTTADGLIVRAGRDYVRAHFPNSGRVDYPPSFDGHVERQATTVTITGTIRETRSARIWALAWGFVTLLMLLIAVLGIYNLASGTSGGWPPLLIGVIAGPLFALFWRGARRGRQPDFASKSAELEDGLQRWFTSGDGQRPFSL